MFRIVLGRCINGEGRHYYQLQFFSLGTPSSTHNDVPISQCVSSCAFSTSGGLFKHNSDTRLCECYNLPQTLTNVQTGAPVWIAGKLYRQDCNSLVQHFEMSNTKLSKHNVLQ